MNKKILSLVLLGIISISAFIPVTNSYASPLTSSIESSIEDSENITAEKENRVLTTKGVTITDEEEIENFAKEHGIDLIVNGEKIKKIETEFVPIENSEKESISSRAYLGTVTNHGTGWYNKDEDIYADITTSGPDTVLISKTESFTATMSDSFGVSASGVSASVGFTIGASYSVTFSSTTPVATGERLNVKAYTTYQKKSAPVYASITNSYKGTVYAYKPTGAYFVKTWY